MLETRLKSVHNLKCHKIPSSGCSVLMNLGARAKRKWCMTLLWFYPTNLTLILAMEKSIVGTCCLCFVKEEFLVIWERRADSSVFALEPENSIGPLDVGIRQHKVLNINRVHVQNGHSVSDASCNCSVIVYILVDCTHAFGVAAVRIFDVTFYVTDWWSLKKSVML